MMQLIDVARMLGSMFMSRQSLDCRRSRLGVQGREHEVSCHRSAEGDLGGFLVANLADEQHVGIRAQHGSEAVREAQPGPRVDLDLVESGRAVLDRVLDRRQLAVGRVQHLEARVERRRLARAGRADDDDGAEGLCDRALERGAASWPHAERVERIGRLALREDSQRHLLSVGRREDRDSHVDRLAVALDRDATVLRCTALGDVEAAHDLESARDRRALRAGDRGQLAHDAVDAHPDEEASLLRREVDVGCAEVESLRDRAVDEDDGRGVVVQVEDGRVVLGLRGARDDILDIDRGAVVQPS